MPTPPPPISTAYLFMYGSALMGTQGRVGGVVDIGLPIWGASLSGSLGMVAGLADVALSMRASGVSGTLGATTIQEDIIFTVESIYGSAVSGTFGSARMFIDPSESVANRYLPAGDSR